MDTLDSMQSCCCHYHCHLFSRMVCWLSADYTNTNYFLVKKKNLSCQNICIVYSTYDKNNNQEVNFHWKHTSSMKSGFLLQSATHSFSWHGRWAHPYPGISLTFWQCRDVLHLEQKCSKHWTQQTWMLQACTCLISVFPHELSAYLRMECNFFMCFLELVRIRPEKVSNFQPSSVKPH